MSLTEQNRLPLNQYAFILSRRKGHLLTASKKYNCASPHYCNSENSIKFLVSMFNEKYPGLDNRAPALWSKFSLVKGNPREATSHVLGFSVSISKMGKVSLCLDTRVVLGLTWRGNLCPLCPLSCSNSTNAMSHHRRPAPRTYWKLKSPNLLRSEQGLARDLKNARLKGLVKESNLK